MVGAPVWSNTMTVYGTPPPPPVGTLAITLGAYTPASAMVPPGIRAFSTLQMTLSATTASVTVTGIRISGSGTLNDLTELDAVYLYRDANNNGRRDTGIDSLLAGPVTFPSDDGKANFTGFSRTINVGAQESWIILYDVDAAAVAGRTFRSGLAGPTDVTVLTGTTPPTVNVSAFNGNTMTVTTVSSGTLTLAPGAAQPEPMSLDAGTAGYEVFHLKLTAGPVEGVRVQNLVIESQGTMANPSAFVTLNLYRDTNGNDALDAVDVLLMGPIYFMAESTSALVWNLNRTVPAGAAETWIVTADFSTATPDAENIGLFIPSPDYVSAYGTISGAKIMPSGLPIEGNNFTILGGGGGGGTTGPSTYYHYGAPCAGGAAGPDGRGGTLGFLLLLLVAALAFRRAGFRNMA